jgi:hypothetical protein
MQFDIRRDVIEKLGSSLFLCVRNCKIDREIGRRVPLVKYGGSPAAREPPVAYHYSVY